MARAATKAAMARALAALDAAGLVAASILIRPGGEVEIIAAPRPPPGQSLTPPATRPDVDSLDDYRERKLAGRAAQGS